jgi:hypothetical protein
MHNLAIEDNNQFEVIVFKVCATNGGLISAVS